MAQHSFQIAKYRPTDWKMENYWYLEIYTYIIIKKKDDSIQHRVTPAYPKLAAAICCLMDVNKHLCSIHTEGFMRNVLFIRTLYYDELLMIIGLKYDGYVSIENQYIKAWEVAC